MGCSGWDSKYVPANVRKLGHVPTADHNAFNTTPLAVLNIARDSMAATGYSPATRVFEAAGAAAYIITDAWEGIDLRSEEHTSELQSLMRISYAVFCLKKKNNYEQASKQ